MPEQHLTPDLHLAHERLVGDLRDLVAALDRCVPRADHDAEHQFTRHAAVLKQAALVWLQALSGTQGGSR